MNDNYEDIINLPHHVSKRHRQMPLAERAAQFAPFAALEGHAAAVSSTRSGCVCRWRSGRSSRLAGTAESGHTKKKLRHIGACRASFCLRYMVII